MMQFVRPDDKTVRDLKEKCPIIHKTLSEKAQANAKISYKEVGRIITSTLEEWEVGFMRDQDPDQETKRWANMASVIRLYINKHLAGIEPQDSDKAMLVGAILNLDNYKEACEFVSSEVIDKIKECWTEHSQQVLNEQKT